jgi:hypothetical protein
MGMATTRTERDTMGALEVPADTFRSGRVLVAISLRRMGLAGLQKIAEGAPLGAPRPPNGGRVPAGIGSLRESEAEC